MQRRRKQRLLVAAIVLTGLAITFVLFISHLRAFKTPNLSISVVGYETWQDGPAMMAKLLLTNAGSATVILNLLSSQLRAETNGNWTVLKTDGGALLEIILRPGEKHAFKTGLPPRTMKWQTSFNARPATLNETLTLQPNWMRLNHQIKKAVTPFFPKKEAYTRVWSDLFEAPGNGVLAFETEEKATPIDPALEQFLQPNL